MRRGDYRRTRHCRALPIGASSAYIPGMRILVRVLAVFALACAPTLGGSGCGCISKPIPRPYAAPTWESVLAHLAGVRARARSYQAESVMDYWVGKDRVKGKVLLMGMTGARVRINALNPTGGMVAADLACDRGWFQFIDYNSNCQLTGPCNRNSVAQLLRVSLEPDDFLLLAVGTTPVIAGPHEGQLRWDEKKGREVLTLTGAGGLRQIIVLDGRDQRWDVLESKVMNAQGETLWRLQNKEFKAIEVEIGEPAVEVSGAATGGGAGGTDELPLDMADLANADPDDLDGGDGDTDKSSAGNAQAGSGSGEPASSARAGKQIWRVPQKTRFTQPQDKADLVVRWLDRTLGAALPEDKFRMAIPPGLPECR